MSIQFEEGITLDRFLLETSKSHPRSTGQFVTLLHQVTLATKMISSRVNRAGLAGMLGGTGEKNVQDEWVMKLDVYANDTLKKALEHPGVCCAIGSEEEEDPIYTPEQFHSGRYVFVMDPLDGSSNIDVNATIGTIFGIFRRKTAEGTPASIEDLLRRGDEMIAAGYVIYGSGTLLVLATADSGVNGFTLDPGIGEFFLSHPDIRLEPTGNLYSINEGYRAQWDERLCRFVDSLKEPERKMSQRYIGSLVADFHRNLIKGGVFLYPATATNPSGKLRLLYEAFPLAFIVELAGGSATDGKDRILSKTLEQLHQRTPLIIGNVDLVTEATAVLSGG